MSSEERSSRRETSRRQSPKHITGRTSLDVVAASVSAVRRSTALTRANNSRWSKGFVT